MKITDIHYSMLIFLLLFISCSVEPQKIKYGHDACRYCKMTIVDKRYGAEVVTIKGKIHMFDAIECMVNYINGGEQKDFAYVMVTDFTSPGEFIDAKKAVYLQSKKMPSPMGMYLTAFKNKQTTIEFMQNNGGTIYSWESLQKLPLK